MIDSIVHSSHPIHVVPPDDEVALVGEMVVRVDEVLEASGLAHDEGLRARLLETANELLINVFDHGLPGRASKLSIGYHKPDTFLITLTGFATPSDVERMESLIHFADSGHDVIGQGIRKRLSTGRPRGIGLYWVARNAVPHPPEQPSFPVFDHWPSESASDLDEFAIRVWISRSEGQYST
jgi:hypothetical protein